MNSWSSLKKTIIVILLITFAVSILSIGCSNKMKEWEMGIYITDLNSNIANKVFITYAVPDQVDWALDSKHFAVIENVINRKGRMINSFVRVFETENNREIKLPPELNDTKIKSRSIAWVDNESLVIRKHTLSTDQYFLYNFKDTLVKEITEDESYVTI